MKKLLRLTLLLLLPAFTQGQTYLNNGKLDDFSELAKSYSVPFVMHDGIKLMTDIYLPITQDCLIVPITLPAPVNQTLNLELIKKGTQLIIYDSIGMGANRIKNPNPFQLPMILSRTPYNKGNGKNAEGAIIAILGYAYAVQDMRGRYTSEGVYLPLMSDSWDKSPYHPNVSHILDNTPLDDPHNGNHHEDGHYTIKYIVDSLKRSYDFNYDGIVDTVDFLTNGRIGMLGGSALGYNQYQASAARKMDSDKPGLKCLLPIVAPGEFYKSTGFQNGVLRDRLVTGWLKGQIFTGTDDDLIPFDNDIQNNIHSSKDYDLPKTITLNGETRTYQQNKFDAANLAIDHFVAVRYEDQNGNLGPAGYYPNSKGRADMDNSRAMVNALGESDPNGTFSRYTNMEVPCYHLFGWWDIFVDGQLETWAYMRKYLDVAKKNRGLQKAVIGPWAHQTMGQMRTGDRTYPDNVMDLMGINFDDFDTQTNVPIGKAITSEVIGWYRYNLNYQPEQYLGEPSCMIPESRTAQVFGSGLTALKIRMPAKDIILPYRDLLALLNGTGGIKNMSVGVSIGPLQESIITFDVPAFGNPLVAGLSTDAIEGIPYRNFADPSEIANARVYIVGPNNDSLRTENLTLGNYWLSADTFPIAEPFVQRKKMYLHQNGDLNLNPPTSDEGFSIYVHDPDDPIRSVGGANMIVRTPDGDRNSQGQFNIKDPRYAPFTVDRPGVISFTTEEIQDSLCALGFPVATIYAKTNPGGAVSGPTDTDFMVRIIDVYPDGREYFVTEGCVNARARDYVRNLVEHPEWDSEPPFINDNTPFTNIDIGKIYEYKFHILPLGYTFGNKHKIKVLISSSSFTRWQVNPNLPIEDGEFFRRKPGDGQSYIFNGQEMMPRVAVQRVAYSPQYPTNIDFPIYTQQYVGLPSTVTMTDELAALVYPNPTNDVVNVYMSKQSNYRVSFMTIAGKKLFETNGFTDLLTLDVSKYPTGMYFVEIQDMNNNKRVVKKINKL